MPKGSLFVVCLFFFCFCCLLILWIAGVGVLHMIDRQSLKTSGELSSQSELEEALAKEKAVLNLDLVPIEIAFSNNLPSLVGAWTISQCNEEQGCMYRIEIGPAYKFKGTIRHELYHIYDNHPFNLGSEMSFFDFIAYLFFYEPQANAYATFGWRL